jgi:septal ring factor EnvC (AmiA/AmiB activator)
MQERSKLQKKLKKLEAERLRAKKGRNNLRTTLEELRENPEEAEKLKKFCRDKPSKTRIEEDQPQLLKIIVDIVTNGAAADEIRC